MLLVVTGVWLLYLSSNAKGKPVYTSSKNNCECVILTHVDRMNTIFLITKTSWRQAVRLKPTGAYCRCCKPSASTPQAKEIGCLLASALEGKENIYSESIQTEFLIIKRFFHKVLVHWVQFEFTICCQCCQWRNLTISLICRARYLDVSIAKP